MSKFARPWNLLLTPDERRLVGPIAAGRRASTARAWGGYQMQCYNKGAMVLHMLRSLLSGLVRDRDVFREVMQDFLATYTGKNASTVDFQRIVEKHTGASWQPYFDQWVYGTDIPTLTWSSQSGPGADGKTVLTLNVKTTDAPLFRQPVPVQLTFKGDKTGSIFVPIDGPDKTISIPVPEAPKKVVLAPRYSVLAKIKEQ
jgi:predicted metalloprotease with PDZ domain